MSPSIILMLPLAVVLVGLARFAMWLFPEQTGNRNHYEGNFGETDQTLRPLDDLSNDEHNAVGAFFGYCEGDTHE